MLVGAMIEHPIENDPEAACMASTDQLLQHPEVPKLGVYGKVVGSVVLVVARAFERRNLWYPIRFVQQH